AKERGVWSTTQTKAEISEQQDKLEQDFRQPHRHEREYLSEQKFRSGDAGDIDLQDGLLLSFPRHGERGQEGREHRDAQNEYPRAEELLGRTSGVVPEPDFRMNRFGTRQQRRALIIGLRNL